MSIAETLEKLYREYERDLGKSKHATWSKMKETVRERGFIFFIPSKGFSSEKEKGKEVKE